MWEIARTQVGFSALVSGVSGRLASWSVEIVRGCNAVPRLELQRDEALSGVNVDNLRCEGKPVPWDRDHVSCHSRVDTCRVTVRRTSAPVSNITEPQRRNGPKEVFFPVASGDRRRSRHSARIPPDSPYLRSRPGHFPLHVHIAQRCDHSSNSMFQVS